MLQKILSEITILQEDNTTFSETYMQYVLDMQDKLIEQEVSYMLKNYIYDINLVDRAIISSLESLVKINDQ